MTAEEYWHGDADLTKFYRKANKLKIERKNKELWLQGLYIYDAICAVSPVLRAFSKAKKPSPYPSEPYDLWKEKEPEKAQSKETDPAKAYIEAWAARVNASFDRKKRGGK